MRKIERVIIFGDSASDIGNKASGLLPNFLLHTENGRFSDGKIWADYFMEWATGIAQNITQHNSKKGREEIILLNETQYCNYAVGGDLGAEKDSHEFSMTKNFLGTFSAQVDKYLKQTKNESKIKETLFFIWFGANDLLTLDAKTISAIVQNIDKQIKRLKAQHHDNAHFIVFDLPDASQAPRYFSFKPSEKKELSERIAHLNKSLYENFQDDSKNLSCFSLSELMDVYYRSNDVLLSQIPNDKNVVSREGSDLTSDLTAEINKYKVKRPKKHLDSIALMELWINQRLDDHILYKNITNLLIKTRENGSTERSTFVKMLTKCILIENQRKKIKSTTVADKLHPTTYMHRLIATLLVVEVTQFCRLSIGQLNTYIGSDEYLKGATEFNA